MNDNQTLPHHPLSELMRSHTGGRMLDVATRYGDFIGVLRRTIENITHTTGIDITVKSLYQARNTYRGKGVSFAAASVLALPFADSTFDTVAMSNALHHLPDTQAGIAEMVRVLKPGGMLVIAEYAADAPTQAQASFIALHNLGGEIARSAGISHNPFYSASDIRDIVGGVGLSDVRDGLLFDTTVDRDPASIQRAVDGFSSHLADIRDQHSHERYRHAMTTAHLRASRTGIQRPAHLIITGRKQASG